MLNLERMILKTKHTNHFLLQQGRPCILQYISCEIRKGWIYCGIHVTILYQSSVDLAYYEIVRAKFGKDDFKEEKYNYLYYSSVDLAY